MDYVCLSDSIYPVRDSKPKLIIAAAEAGLYSQRSEDEVDKKQVPSQLERALLCRKLSRDLGWQVLPWELDDMDVRDIKLPLSLLSIYDTHQKLEKDVSSLNAHEANLIAYVRTLQELMGGSESSD